MTTVEQWQEFFSACEIPSDTCAKFARTFYSQRIQPDMLEDLDRETFGALGVTMIGDQISIARYSKRCNGKIPAFAKKSESARRVNAAPDRHDIYHIRLPEGSTEKTREIIRKHDVLKQEGMIKRGTNGVRKGGEPVAGLARVSATSTVITKRKPGVVGAPSVILKSPSEVVQRRSTTTAIPKYGTLVSDSMVGALSGKPKSVMVSDVSSSSSVASRLRGGEPTFLITLGGTKKSGLPSRLSGGHAAVQRNVHGRASVASRLGVRGSDRRPIVMYTNDDDDDYEMEEEIIYKGKPSVFDRVSAKKRF